MAQSVVSAKLGPFRKRVDSVLADMAQKRIAARLWAKDHRLWKPLEAHQRPVVRVQLARNTASSIKTLITNTTQGRRRALRTSRTSRRKR